MMTETSRSDIEQAYMAAVERDLADEIYECEKKIAMLRHIVKAQYYAIKHLEEKIRDSHPV